MLARNLVYTAISRAKEMMVLVGTRKALAIGVKNDRVLARNTGLAGRLEGAFDEVYRDAAVF
jgi:exodeoxyribonuclease V alpha subunit